MAESAGEMLPPQAWLKAAETRAVMAALEAAGGAGCARFVGGCVRNAVLNRPVDDIDIATVQTNIVIFSLGGICDVAPLLAKMKKRGVLAGTAAANQIRFVTHKDVDKEACEEALRITAEVLASA